MTNHEGEPAAVSIEVSPDYTVMALSYALGLEELTALAETREPVSADEWLASGGPVVVHQSSVNKIQIPAATAKRPTPTTSWTTACQISPKNSNGTAGTIGMRASQRKSARLTLRTVAATPPQDP